MVGAIENLREYRARCASTASVLVDSGNDKDPFITKYQIITSADCDDINRLEMKDIKSVSLQIVLSNGTKLTTLSNVSKNSD